MFKQEIVYQKDIKLQSHISGILVYCADKPVILQSY